MGWNPVRWFFIGMIRVYQRVISPWLGPHCRFQPTCSEYAAESIRKCGVIKGLGLAVWRVLRCNPLCKGGYDPVPGADTRGDVTGSGQKS